MATKEPEADPASRGDCTDGHHPEHTDDRDGNTTVPVIVVGQDDRDLTFVADHEDITNGGRTSSRLCPPTGMS